MSLFNSSGTSVPNAKIAQTQSRPSIITKPASISIKSVSTVEIVIKECTIIVTIALLAQAALTTKSLRIRLD